MYQVPFPNPQLQLGVFTQRNKHRNTGAIPRFRFERQTWSLAILGFCRLLRNRLCWDIMAGDESHSLRPGTIIVATHLPLATLPPTRFLPARWFLLRPKPSSPPPPFTRTVCFGVFVLLVGPLFLACGVSEDTVASPSSRPLDWPLSPKHSEGEVEPPSPPACPVPPPRCCGCCCVSCCCDCGRGCSSPSLFVAASPPRQPGPLDRAGFVLAACISLSFRQRQTASTTLTDARRSCDIFIACTYIVGKGSQV